MDLWLKLEKERYTEESCIFVKMWTLYFETIILSSSVRNKTTTLEFKKVMVRKIRNDNVWIKQVSILLSRQREIIGFILTDLTWSTYLQDQAMKKKLLEDWWNVSKMRNEVRIICCFSEFLTIQQYTPKGASFVLLEASHLVWNTYLYL